MDARTVKQLGTATAATDLGALLLGRASGGAYQPLPLNAAATAVAVDATVTPVENTTVVSGAKNVTAAGTAVPLAVASTLINKVDIQAKLTNTDTVHIGSSAVDESTNPGMVLFAGDSYTLLIDDLNKIYVDAQVNGEGVTFNYYL